MTCIEVMDALYEAGGEEALPIVLRVRIMVHLFFCGRCAEAARKLALARHIMTEDFFPPSPAFEDRVMANVYAECDEAECGVSVPAPVPATAPQGVSLRGWVITGFIIVISLATSFFGVGFTKIVSSTQGQSFLLPVGLTIGCIVTGYGAIFIGSHLKEMSDRFLH
jgi:hypothetical protein